MDVCYIYRKKQEGYFSIEKIFKQVASLLPGKIAVKSLYMPHGRLLPGNIFQNIKTAKAIKADVYHVTGDVHYAVLGTPGNKSVLTIHDCVFLHTTTGIKRWLLKLLFLKWPVKHCRTVTTISEKSRHEIIRYSGCQPDKVIVVPNPVGDQFYYMEKDFNATCPTLLFIGSTPNKNLERVIHALHGINCRLVIVGHINDNHKQLLTDRQVPFQQLSGLSEKELADVYADSDIVLFPSTYEGFGLPVIEAQKSGRPVVTSHISPMKEVAGEGACFVDPMSVESIKNGIQQVINDALYRNMIVEKGFSNVQQFDAHVISEKYLTIYRDIISH